jgi:hypothetical protein
MKPAVKQAAVVLGLGVILGVVLFVVYVLLAIGRVVTAGARRGRRGPPAPRGVREIGTRGFAGRSKPPVAHADRDPGPNRCRREPR